LLDLSLGLFVLKKLGLEFVRFGYRDFLLQNVIPQLDAALKSHAWSDIFEDEKDAMVWMMVFEYVGLSAFASRRLYVQRAVQQARQNHVGPWEKTSRFVTHVVFVLSDWGCKPVQEPCQDEFIYILDNLPRALAIDHIELVGEFLHCLRILNCRLSAAQQALVQRGKDLLKRHMVANSSQVSYHTAWCVVVGLGA